MEYVEYVIEFFCKVTPLLPTKSEWTTPLLIIMALVSLVLQCYIAMINRHNNKKGRPNGRPSSKK